MCNGDLNRRDFHIAYRLNSKISVEGLAKTEFVQLGLRSLQHFAITVAQVRVRWVALLLAIIATAANLQCHSYLTVLAYSLSASQPIFWLQLKASALQA